MKIYRNNHKRGKFRNNDRNYKRNGEGKKFGVEYSSAISFQRKFPGRNNHNASKLVEKYNDLAREALSKGDKILSENYFQHAEHFIRVLEEKDALNSKNNASNELNKEKIEKDQKNTNNIDQKISEQSINSEN